MNFSYRFGWAFFRVSFAIYFGRRAFNAARVPRTGPVILASNHASYVDSPLIGIALARPINYLARDTLFRFPVWGTILRSWGVVPVNRDGAGGAGLKAILDRLLAGAAIILYPEGGRTRTGGLMTARSGIGLVVIKSTAAVVPVRVFGTFAAWNADMTLPRPRPIAVKFGEPMRFEKQREEAKHCSKARLKEIYQEIADEIMVVIAKLEPHEDKAGFP